MEKNFIRKEVESTHAFGRDRFITRSKLVNPSFLERNISVQNIYALFIDSWRIFNTYSNACFLMVKKISSEKRALFCNGKVSRCYFNKYLDTIYFPKHT